jgi:hypothetical protein
MRSACSTMRTPTRPRPSRRTPTTRGRDERHRRGRAARRRDLVDVAADFTTGDETYTFNVISSASANLSSPDRAQLARDPAGTLTWRAQVLHVIPSKTQRYLGWSLTMGGTTPLDHHHGVGQAGEHDRDAQVLPEELHHLLT